MNLNLTTAHQDRVLNILRSDGNLIFDYEAQDGYMLTDEQGNTETVRSDTVRKLIKLHFLVERIDFPTIGIWSYHLTKLGKEWLEANKIEHYNPF